MSQSAYIKLVEESEVPSLTLDELKDRLMKYKEQLSLTGKQLGWEYEEVGFPYTIETKPEGKNNWFYLKGTNPSYKYIVFGIGSEKEEDQEVHYIQILLPDDSTFGDKSKGNEICRHLAKTLKAQLHLFNGRIMYFYPRK